MIINRIFIVKVKFKFKQARTGPEYYNIKRDSLAKAMFAKIPVEYLQEYSYFQEVPYVDRLCR